MSGIMDFLDSLPGYLADALPNSIFANVRNSRQLRAGLADAQNSFFGKPADSVQVTPQVGTLPGEQSPQMMDMGGRGSAPQLNMAARAPMYQQSGPAPGFIDSLPAALQPGIKNMALSSGIADAVKEANAYTQQKPMTAEGAASTQLGRDRFDWEKSQPLLVPDGSTFVDRTTHQPVITGQPKPPVTRTIQRGDQTITQELDLKTNQFKDVSTAPRQLPLQPQAPMSDARLKQEEELLREKQRVQSVDDATRESQAQAIANYQQPGFTGISAGKPENQITMRRVMEINPNYRAQNFKMSNDAQSRFASGPQGNLVRSFNVGISHLNTLDKLSDALGNNDIQAVNSLRNTFREQFGADAPTNFDAAKAIVGDEIIKAIVGGGGALADRENAQNQISRAKTPSQLKGVIKTYKDLMAGQLKGLKQQYKTSTFLDNFNEKLAPETITELEGAPATTAAPQTGAAPNPGKPPPPAKNAVVDGFRFLGGDPKLQRNWQKVQ